MDLLTAIIKTSMALWYPKIQQLEYIPKPDTILILLSKEESINLESLIDGGTPDQRLLNRIKVAANKIGYPIFLRTDYLSAKHEWEEACFVPSEKDLNSHLFRLVETSMMCDQALRALAIRQYIPMESKFKAFRGLPIAKERRIFARQGKIICHHPYWPPDCIHFYRGTPEPDNWEDLITYINTITKEETKMLEDWARQVSNLFEDAWSIDFCKGQNGTWYLIDMAIAEVSYHWDGCPEALNLNIS